MKDIPERFAEANITAWATFWSNYPLKVQRIPPERLHSITEDFIPKCSFVLPDDARVEKHTTRYAECISYRNKVAGNSQLSKKDVHVGRADLGDVPVLKKGDLVCCLSPLDSLQHGEAGAREPFWIGQLTQNEEIETDERGARLRPAVPTDSFNVHWLGVFEPVKKGASAANTFSGPVLVCLTNSVTGVWAPRCGYKRNVRSNVHPWCDVRG
eukprot:6191500-Pleurochrysis_carterae.AAC.1